MHRLAKTRVAGLAALLAAGLLAGSACGRTPAPAGTTAAPAGAAPAPAGPTAAPAGATPAPAGPTPVTLLLNYIYNGQHAPFLAGVEQGIYQRHGLDVTVREGNGSATTVKLAAGNAVEFAYADAPTAAMAVAEGMPVRVVATYVQQTPMAVIARAEAGLLAPADLVGKRIAVTHGDALTPIFPALMRKSGLDPGQVSLVSLGTPAAKEAALLQGEVDGYLGYFFAQEPRLEARHGFDVSALRFSDHGIVLLSSSLVASPRALEQPDLVRRFLAATAEAFAYTRDHPEAAAEIFARHAAERGYDPQLALTEIQLVMPLWYTPRSSGQPFGWMAEQDWADSLALLQEYAGFQGPLDPTRYYTNEFIPTGAGGN